MPPRRFPKTSPNVFRADQRMERLDASEPHSATRGILPLRVDGVSFVKSGLALLEGISFALEGPEIAVILGPNGAGKSLLLRICHGLLNPTSGTVEWRGVAGTEARQRQAMVFQRPVLLRRSVAANIGYALHIRGINKHERSLRIAESLELTALAPLAKRNARVLSGGEQQRLALARAWAVQPDVLFLDEPTASLDPAGTRAVEEIVTAFKKRGTKIVMTTHDLAQARRLADEILFLQHGRLLVRESTSRFFEYPSHPDAEAFVRGDLLW